MNRFFNLFLILFLLFLVSCLGTTPPKENLDKQTNYFYTKYQKPIAIFPTYKYLGEKKIESAKAFREYHVWREAISNKYILITIFRPKKDSFSENIKWIDRENALYSEGNIAAFNSLHPRVQTVIDELGGKIPDCFIIVQHFYIDKDRKEAIFKALIAPDDMCAEDVQPVIEELNRVANMQ